MIIFPFQFAGFGFKGFIDPPDNIDKYYLNTSLLLHAEGANGSTTFTDTSPTVKTVTPTGNAIISTTQKYYGGSAAYFDGNGDYLSVAYHTDIDFVASEFTIEMYIYPTTIKGGGTRVISSGGGTVGWNGTNGIHFLCQLSPSGAIDTQISTNTGSPTGGSSSATIAVNTWSHVTISVVGTSLYIGVNGTVQSFTTGTIARPSTNPSLAVATIPGEGGNGTYAFAGYIDDLRITKGVARYTSNYVVPIKEFPETQGLGYRYWRLNTTANNGSSNLAIGDLQLRNKVGGTSVATGGTASASTTNGGNVAANGFDGSAATLWNAATNNGWLKYDFGGGNEKTITEFVVQSRSDGYTSDAPKDFTLEYSSDNTVWFTVATITNQTGWTAGQSRTFRVTY